uniref:Uncharacterized protein n=1 Tax=Romanomermis culicivorax TaxID=13658 RepID=A0A915K0Z6_ROMCU
MVQIQVLRKETKRPTDLIMQAPHGIVTKKMDYMYNCSNILPIIFEERRAKQCSEGDNITIDKGYQEDCSFFQTMRC